MDVGVDVGGFDSTRQPGYCQVMRVFVTTTLPKLEKTA